MFVLHLLLILLKVIGILLVILLGLVLLVLLVPIRYSFSVRYKQGEDPGASVSVTWFIKLLHIRGSFEDKKLFYEAKVAWKKIISSEPEDDSGKKKPKKKKDKKKDDQAADQSKPESVQTEKKAAEDKQSKDGQTEKKAEADKKTASDKKARASQTETTGANKKSKTEKKKAEADKKARASQAEKAGADKKSKTEKKKAEADKKARASQAENAGADKKSKTEKKKAETDKADRKKNSTSSGQEDHSDEGILDKLSVRLEPVKSKIDMVRDYYRDYRVGELIPFVRGIVFSIIKHILPTKLEGYVRYGFDDPALTGKITAYAAMFYPAYARSFTLEPDFCQVCLEADVKGKGRIRLGFFVWILIKMLLNKHVRHDIILFLKR